MYRQGVYYCGNKAEIRKGIVAEITRLLGDLNMGDRAPELLKEIGAAAHEYQQMSMLHVDRNELKQERERLKKIANLSTKLTAALRAIDTAVGNERYLRLSTPARAWLEQYLIVEKTAGLTKAVDRIFRDIETLQRAAARAANDSAMNSGVGGEADRYKYRLARRVANKYREITGETDAQMRSNKGTFQQVLIYALVAAGAADNTQTSVNAKVLKAAVAR